MSKFWDLMERSVIVQSLVTLVVVATMCYLVATAQQVNEAFIGLCMTIVGYWFGSKESVAIQRLRATRTES